MTPEQLRMEQEERKMIAQMELLRRSRTPEALATQERFRVARQQAMQPAQAVGPAPGSRPPNPFLSGLSQLGRRALDVMQDPAARARLAAGLQSMTVNPNQQLIQGQLQRARDIQTSRQVAQQENQAVRQANMTAQYLRTIGRDNLANLIEANPSMATEVLSQLFTAKDTFATKGFAPQIDPQTGQMFGVQYDPNTGKYTRVDIKDAIGETPAQILERETLTELERADLERAMQAGQDAFVAAERATGTIDTLTRALSALGEGAESGVVANLLPSFNRATTELRQAATEMGIDLIQSATFGALSESELKLALSSTIDLSLPGPELRELLENKIRVQQILRDELMKKARELSAGKVKYSDFIQRYEIKGGVEPAKVTVVRPEDL